MLNGLLKAIQEIRENGFEKSLNEAKDTAKNLNIFSEFTNKRKIKIKRTTFKSTEEETKNNESTENKLRIQYFEH